MSHQPDNITAGTQVVSLVQVRGPNGSLVHPRGAVGVVTRTPAVEGEKFLVRFPDGFEKSLECSEVEVLKHFKDRLGDGAQNTATSDPGFDLESCIIYRCVTGSRAYGLDTDESDTDRRGVYIAPAELQWSLFGAPEQFEDNADQSCYWELQKFVIMALRANPNILECLYSPLVEKVTPVGEELLALREQFLSQMVFQTFNGYAMSQFKKIEQDLRNSGEIKWKHAMHLLRLLLTGAATLREGRVPVRVETHRDRLLAIKRGEVPWLALDDWRKELHREFERALGQTKLSERPNYEAANRFLVKARRELAKINEIRKPHFEVSSASPSSCDVARAEPRMDCEPLNMASDPRLYRIVAGQPYPLLFATISGAHLYGFPSPDSDFDLRGAHVLPLENVVGLDLRDETVEDSRVIEGLEMDIVSHDVRKFFGLLLKKNGYVLEQVFSPLIIHTTPGHQELKNIAGGCVSKHHSHHYFGFAETQWSLFMKEAPRRVKPLLYVYRVLLTGIYLMRTGEIEANLLRLNAEFRLPYIDDLVARKLAGPEKATLDEADLAFHESEYQRLRGELQSAHDASRLPESPSEETRSALNDLLLRVRLQSGR